MPDPEWVLPSVPFISHSIQGDLPIEDDALNTRVPHDADSDNDYSPALFPVMYLDRHQLSKLKQPEFVIKNNNLGVSILTGAFVRIRIGATYKIVQIKDTKFVFHNEDEEEPVMMLQLGSLPKLIPSDSVSSQAASLTQYEPEVEDFLYNSEFTHTMTVWDAASVCHRLSTAWVWRDHIPALANLSATDPAKVKAMLDDRYAIMSIARCLIDKRQQQQKQQRQEKLVGTKRKAVEPPITTPPEPKRQQQEESTAKLTVVEEPEDVLEGPPANAKEIVAGLTKRLMDWRIHKASKMDLAIVNILRALHLRQSTRPVMFPFQKSIIGDCLRALHTQECLEGVRPKRKFNTKEYLQVELQEALNKMRKTGLIQATNHGGSDVVIHRVEVDAVIAWLRDKNIPLNEAIIRSLE